MVKTYENPGAPSGAPPSVAPPSGGSYFVGADGIVEAVRDAEPDDSHVGIRDDLDAGMQSARVGPVEWAFDSEYVLEIPAEKVLFMEGNLWDHEHAAAVASAMAHGEAFKIPPARVYRIDREKVRATRRYAKAGELEYQYNMTRPWSEKDVGTYYAQLLDGNHRAAAALSLGARSILVHVGQNHRDDVRKKDYFEPAQRRTRRNPAAPLPVAVCGCGWSWQIEADDPDPLLCHRCWKQAAVQHAVRRLP